MWWWWCWRTWLISSVSVCAEVMRAALPWTNDTLYYGLCFWENFRDSCIGDDQWEWEPSVASNKLNLIFLLDLAPGWYILPDCMTRNVATSWSATELAINLVIARGCAQGHSNRAIVWTFAPPLLKYNLVPWCYVCDQVMYAVDTGQCAGWWWWYPFPRFCKPPPLSGYCHIPLRRSQTVCLFVIISVWPPATLLPLALLPSCQYFTCWLIFGGNLLLCKTS